MSEKLLRLKAKVSPAFSKAVGVNGGKAPLSPSAEGEISCALLLARADRGEKNDSFSRGKGQEPFPLFNSVCVGLF